ncbi:MAG: hypothetical protein ACOX08_01745 [Methanobacterium sp.]|jgi:hypothetical protein
MVFKDGAEKLIKKGAFLTFFVFLGVLVLSININPVSNASLKSDQGYVEVKAVDSFYGGYVYSENSCDDVLISPTRPLSSYTKMYRSCSPKRPYSCYPKNFLFPSCRPLSSISKQDISLSPIKPLSPDIVRFISCSPARWHSSPSVRPVSRSVSNCLSTSPERLTSCSSLRKCSVAPERPLSSHTCRPL